MSEGTMRNVIIPAYDPYPGPEWEIIFQNSDRIYAVIVNPKSGVGDHADPVYIAMIDRLRSVGILVLGYVSTRYSGRPLIEISGEVQKWKDWYRPDGIFLDEMSSATTTRLPNGTTRDDLSYYRRASGICYSTIGAGSIVVMNPGAVPDPQYATIAGAILTVSETDEDTYANRDFPAWLNAIQDRTYHIVYAVTDAPWVWAAIAKNNPGFVYLCTTPVPNPQFSIEDTVWPEVPDEPAEQPSPGSSPNSTENFASLALTEVANIIGMPRDSTLKDVPAKVREMVTGIRILESVLEEGIKAATDEEILADVARRLKLKRQ